MKQLFLLQNNIMKHILNIEREVEKLCQITYSTDNPKPNEATQKMTTIVEKLNSLIEQNNKV